MKDWILEYHHQGHRRLSGDFGRPNLGFARPVTISHLEKPVSMRFHGPQQHISAECGES